MDLRAKMTAFAGWEMPLQYTGIVEEHLTVRRAAGIFDVSHMGRIEVSGGGARNLLQRLTTNDIERLSPGRAQYTLICNEEGGVVDDLIIYMLAEGRYLLCVNAANREKDLTWIKGKARKGVVVEDRSQSLAQIALQGPKAEEVLRRFLGYDPSPLRYFHSEEVEVGGLHLIVSRTGYTGEDGFEIYLPSEVALEVWNSLLQTGRTLGIRPCGLGARDTLRVEMGYCLYGHELDESTTPFEAGLGRFVSLEKGNFIGRKALVAHVSKGPTRRLVGFRMVERAIPRQGYPILSKGREIGRVTSGTFSPILRAAIGLGYVRPEWASPGSKVEVAVRDRVKEAIVVRYPFVKAFQPS